MIRTKEVFAEEREKNNKIINKYESRNREQRFEDRNIRL